MTEEDLSTLWEGLKLTEDEEDVVLLTDQSIKEADTRGKNCLMAMIITGKNFNKRHSDQRCHKSGNWKGGFTLLTLVTISLLWSFKKL